MENSILTHIFACIVLRDTLFVSKFRFSRVRECIYVVI